MSGNPWVFLFIIFINDLDEKKYYTLIGFLRTPVKKGKNTSDDIAGLQKDVSSLE